MYSILVVVLVCEINPLSFLSIHSTPPDVPSHDVTSDDGASDDVTPCLHVTLCGRLQCRALRLLDPDTHTALECVTFDPTYYDTETIRCSSSLCTHTCIYRYGMYMYMYVHVCTCTCSSRLCSFAYMYMYVGIFCTKLKCT